MKHEQGFMMGGTFINKYKDLFKSSFPGLGLSSPEAAPCLGLFRTTRQVAPTHGSLRSKVSERRDQGTSHHQRGLN